MEEEDGKDDGGKAQRGGGKRWLSSGGRVDKEKYGEDLLACERSCTAAAPTFIGR